MDPTAVVTSCTGGLRAELTGRGRRATECDERVGSAGENAALQSFPTSLQKNVLDRPRGRMRDERDEAILSWSAIPTGPAVAVTARRAGTRQAQPERCRLTLVECHLRPDGAVRPRALRAAAVVAVDAPTLSMAAATTAASEL